MYVSVMLRDFGGVSVASLLRLARHLAEHKRLTYLLQGVGFSKSPSAVLLIFLGMVMQRSVRWRSDVQSDKNQMFSDSLPCNPGESSENFLVSVMSICG